METFLTKNWLRDKKVFEVWADAGVFLREWALIRFFLPTLVIAAVVLRLWDLENIPPGAYVDETSIGYNAYSIQQTGRDESGLSFPVFFRAFGEYKNPIFIYSLVALLEIFDLSVWTVRLCAALYGLGASVLLGLLVRESMDGRYAWASGFLIASVMPWLFVPSRVGFEAVSLTFFLALAWWGWLRAIKSNPLPWFLVSWSAWGLSIFTYTSARLMVPVFVLVLIGCYFKELRRRWVRVLIGSIPFILCLAVLVSWCTENPGSLTARLNQVSLWRRNPNILSVAYQFASNFTGYFSPAFLFTKGDPDLRNHTGYGGELFLFMLPALLAGVAHAWQQRHQPLQRFTLIGFILFPLAGSLTVDANHALRTLNAIPFVSLLIAWGFERLRWLVCRWRALVVIFGLFAALETGRFYYDYFHNYPTRAGIWFNARLPEALKVVFKESRSAIYYSPLAFEDENSYVNQPYIQFLFFGKLDPRTFQAKNLAGFDIYPYRDGMSLPRRSILLLKDVKARSTGTDLTLNWDQTSDLPPKSELIATFPLSRDRRAPGFRIYRIH